MKSGCAAAREEGLYDNGAIESRRFRTLENGQQVIDLKQQKTGNHVVIPVRPELQAILEKCDLVKTHTARRSGATNMYLAGILTIAIMKITGHKTEREFMKYIKITETAMELMNRPYFSGK